MRDKEFQVYADCIRSEQIPASEVYELFKEEPEFAAWYRKKYVPNEAEAKIESCLLYTSPSPRDR